LKRISSKLSLDGSFAARLLLSRGAHVIRLPGQFSASDGALDMAKKRRAAKRSKSAKRGKGSKTSSEDTVTALVILVVIILLFAGYYYYQKNMKKAALDVMPTAITVQMT
jgi:hypothetical protein